MQKNSKKIAHTFLAAALFAFVFAAVHPFIAHATVPQKVLYMGKLTDASGTAVANGTYQMKFALYDEAFGDAACLWSAGFVLGIDPGSENPELHCAALASRKSISVTVTNGFFSANLGDTADASDNDTQVFPTNLFDTANTPHTLYLGVTVCGAGSTQVTTSCTENEMTPRKPLTSAPFAQRAKYAEQASGDFTVGTNLGIGTTPSAGLTLGSGKDILGTGTVSFAGTILEQAGIPSISSKIVWNSSKGALRAGSIGDLSAVEGLTNGSAYWDTANLGQDSFASGVNNKVTGIASTAFGFENTVTGLAGAAFGAANTVGGQQSFAVGFQAIASSDTSIAIGHSVTASGSSSIALGSSLTASASNAIAIGSGFTNNAGQSLQVGFSSSPTMGVNSTYLDIFGGKQLRFLGSNSGSLTLGATSDALVLNLSQGAGLEFTGSSNGSVTLKAAAAGGSPVLTLPAGAGTQNQVLSITDVAGDNVILGWANGGGSTLSALTAATSTNNIGNGNFSQDWGWTFDGTGSGWGIKMDATGPGSALLELSGQSGFTGSPLYVMNTGSGNAAYIDNRGTGMTGDNKRVVDAESTATFNTSGGGLTNYGGYFNNTSSRSTGGNALTNIGLYASASGAQNNYAAIFENGKVGIGTTAPSYTLAFGSTSGPGATTIGVEGRNTAQDPGIGLSINAGAATGTNQQGGDLTLSSGAARGNGSSSIIFQAAGGGATGNSFSTPTTKMTINGNSVGIGNTDPAFALLEVGKTASVTGITNPLQPLLVDQIYNGTLAQGGTLYGINNFFTSDVNGNGNAFSLAGTSSTLIVNSNASTVTQGAFASKSTAYNYGASGSMPSLYGGLGSTLTGVNATTSISYGLRGTSIEDPGGNVVTGYGGYFDSYGATTNVGLYATALNGASNYAAIFDQGNVGINNTTPSVALTIGDGTGTTAAAGLTFGSSANLYRSAANTIKTDGTILSSTKFYATATGSRLGGFRTGDGVNAYWSFGRDNVNTGNFVLVPNSTGADTDTPILSITTAGLATFSNYVTAKVTTGSSTAGLCWSGSAAAGQIEDCNGAPSDLAEWYDTESSVSEGDLVALGTKTVSYQGIERDPSNFQKIIPGENETVPIMVKSSLPYQANITGVISSAPYQILGEDLKNKSAHPLPLALAGRVPVKVTTENGAIAPGDYLTSSSTPGVAMKATQAGPTVGMALEGFSGQGTGKVLILVNLNQNTSSSTAPTPTVATGSTTPAPAISSPTSSVVTLGTPSFISGRAELTDALKEVTITLPTNFSTAVDGNYQAFITSTNTPAALFIASQTATSFTVRSMDGVSFGPFNWMALSGTTVATTTQQDVTPDAAGSFENIPTTPGALTSPSGPLSDVLDSAPVQTTNDLIPPIAAASFAGFVVSSGVMVRSAGRRKGLKGYLKSFLALPSVLTRHSAQGFSRMATPNDTGIIDHSYTRFARWHFAAQVLLLVGVNLLLVRAILGLAIKALA